MRKALGCIAILQQCRNIRLSMQLQGNGRARFGVALGAEPEDDGGGPAVPAGRLELQGEIEEAGGWRMQV